MTKRVFKQDEFKETGFGNRVIEPNQRMMNKDGKSNVRRTGLLFYSISNVYHLLITMKWWKFLIIIFSSYLFLNFVFTLLYHLGDLNHLNGMMYTTPLGRFMEVFYFSAQSLTTVGYGRLNPSGYFFSTLASIEAFVGLLSFAIATGLLYGRFSRPVANILFSKIGVVAPYQGITAFMIRLANMNKSELINLESTLLLAYIQDIEGKVTRKFVPLKLELTRINLLTMTWTIVHPIDEESPMLYWTKEDFQKNQVEFIVLIQAYEETFAQNVHARSSYKFEEIVFGAKFDTITKPGENGSVIVELNRINDHIITGLELEQERIN